MAGHAHRASLQRMGLSLGNLSGLLAGLHSVQETHVQNLVLAAMDLTLLETCVMAEWCYIAAMLVTLLNSFGIGLVIGVIWGAL